MSKKFMIWLIILVVVIVGVFLIIYSRDKGFINLGNQTLKDDWQYSPKSFDQNFKKGLTGALPSMMAKGSAPISEEIGLAVGGAKDINNFRQNLKSKFLPIESDLTYEGLFYNYYFQTGQQKKCDQLFCPSYIQAVSKDPFSNKDDYYLSVGLNSGIKESDFKRKKLNLVIVQDISGSMGSPFDQYYYDQYGNKIVGDVEGSDKSLEKSKMKVANESVVAMLKHLNKDDRFGMVLFDDEAYLAKPLTTMSEVDKDKLEKHILAIEENGSTNMEAGIKTASQLFEKYKNNDQSEYENRIIFLTDAMPNTGDTEEENLLSMIAKNADNKIYTTFIGIGVDFNSELVEKISKVRGLNYYSVHSSKEFSKRMDEEFDYMVTPLVFNLQLSIKADGYQIKKVYGSPEADLATGNLMKVNTLFPSKSSESGSKGGVILVQLSKVTDNGLIELSTSYEDRNGKKSQNQVKIDFTNKSGNYYENNGIRKAIILTRYANLVKSWIVDERKNYNNKDRWVPIIDHVHGIDIPIYVKLGEWERQSLPLKLNEDYKKLFLEFRDYFSSEIKEINDNSLNQEMEMINIITK